MADEITDDMAVCLVTAAPAHRPPARAIEELEVDDEHEVGDALERFLRACGVPLGDVPGVLREAGEAARREGSVTVRVRADGFRPGVDVVPGNFVRLPRAPPCGAALGRVAACQPRRKRPLRRRSTAAGSSRSG